VRIESIDSASDVLNNKLDLRDQHWDQHGISRPSLKGVSLSLSQSVPKGYLNGGIARQECQIWIRLGGLQHANYIIVFDCVGDNTESLLSSGVVANEISLHGGHRSVCHLKKPMFVSVGEISKDFKQGRPDGVSSDVGLNPFNRIDNGGTEVVDTFPVIPVSELLRRINNDEGQLIYIGGRIFRRLVLRNTVNKVVEDAPKIVNTIPDHKRPSEEVRLGSMEVDHDSDAGIVCAAFDGERVIATLHPSIDFSVSQFEVFFCAA
jgi:hypothetical protein